MTLSTPTPSTQPQKPVVLYVEDEPDTYRLASIRLKDTYHLLWARSDREACQQLAIYGTKLFAVLMDIELKGSQLNGLQLARLIRGTLPKELQPDFSSMVPTLPSVPIIVLTAYTNKYGEADVAAVGAMHYCAKPIDFTRLTLALAQANVQSVLKRLAPSGESGATRR